MKSTTQAALDLLSLMRGWLSFLPDEGLAFFPGFRSSTQLHGLLQHEVYFALKLF